MDYTGIKCRQRCKGMPGWAIAFTDKFFTCTPEYYFRLISKFRQILEFITWPSRYPYKFFKVISNWLRLPTSVNSSDFGQVPKELHLLDSFHCTRSYIYKYYIRTDKKNECAARYRIAAHEFLIVFIYQNLAA